MVARFLSHSSEFFRTCSHAAGDYAGRFNKIMEGSRCLAAVCVFPRKESDRIVVLIEGVDGKDNYGIIRKRVRKC